MLFPQICILCKASNGGQLGLCIECQKGLPWHDAAHCPQCALSSFNHQHCGHCLKSPPAFDVTQALLRYEYPFNAMLQRFKYSERLNMANIFGALMANAAQFKTQPDLIIPMPIHPQRLQERGFNQSIEFGRVLARELGIKLDIKSCIRTKLTPPQTSLPQKERAKNMRGVFRCNSKLSGLKVALLDDVMTTGASLNSLAREVKKAGAAHVECWVLARTIPQ